MIRVAVCDGSSKEGSKPEHHGGRGEQYLSVQRYYLYNCRSSNLALNYKHLQQTEPLMTETTVRPFHLAFAVDDLQAARTFYKDLLQCGEGRSSADWVDFDFHGHQIVAHLAPEECGKASTNTVDGHGVPVRHFGLVMSMDEWREAANRLTEAGVDFLIKPYVRFEGQVGEQATMFFTDPAGNAIELKAFKNKDQLFKK